MDRCMEITAQAMEALSVKQDIIANNLANASTAGFKRDTAVFKSFPSVFVKSMGELYGGVKFDQVSSDVDQGGLVQTGRQLDCAISGKGYFCVQTPQGERYTRNGSFSIDSEGQLVTSEGYAVQGESGQIFVTGSDVAIGSGGEVIVDGSRAGKLKVVDFESPDKLVKAGSAFFAAPDGVVPADSTEASVVQGSLESSNVKTVKEMVDMIDTLRAFQANQKVIQLKDEMLNKSINQVGKI